MAKYYICFLVYLFAYFQVSPAVEFAAATHLEDNSNLLESSDSQLMKSEALHRQKRFIPFLITVIAGLISGIGATVIGNEINKAIDRSGQGSSNDKPTIINNVINNNINQAQSLKESVSRVDPNAGRAIQVGGFNCDHSFCRRVGDGQASMGICSPHICHCSNGNPHPQQCGVGTVFDPLYRICNWPGNVRVCG